MFKKSFNKLIKKHNTEHIKEGDWVGEQWGGLPRERLVTRGQADERERKRERERDIRIPLLICASSALGGPRPSEAPRSSALAPSEAPRPRRLGRAASSSSARAAR